MEDDMTISVVKFTTSNGTRVRAEVFCVFDGHNGPDVANLAASKFARIFTACWREKDTPTFTSDILEEAMSEVNKLAETRGMKGGCTALCCVVTPHATDTEKLRVTIGHLGDCRAVLCSGPTHTAETLTVDHNPMEDSERKRVISEGGKLFDGGIVSKDGTGSLAVSRALGDFDFHPYLSAKPDIIERDMDCNDDHFMILACDGLWNVFHAQDAVEFAMIEMDSDKDCGMTAKRLVKEAVNVLRTTDNTSVIIIKFKELPDTLSDPEDEHEAEE
eukprot:GFYU01005429.1.p1 GENE.GFYU01005429.1~~GFYU01005429.1.p1  ORF type:complete len:313 (+),score=57.11 GFYU01005429.1:119-940(+)